MLTKDGIIEQLKRKYCRYRYEAMDADPESQAYGMAVWKANEIAQTLLSYGLDVVVHYDINKMPSKDEVRDA